MPSDGFESMRATDVDVDEPLSVTDPVVFDRDPRNGEWIAVSYDSLVSLDDGQ